MAREGDIPFLQHREEEEEEEEEEETYLFCNIERLSRAARLARAVRATGVSSCAARRQNPQN